jgi:hypothetical protein
MKIQPRFGSSSARLGIEALEDRCVPETLSISDATVTEVPFSISYAAVDVTLSEPLKKPVSVKYGTKDGTATAASDYGAVSGTLSFSKGETVKTIRVRVVGNMAAVVVGNTATVGELEETFTVRLTGAKGATISDGVGVVTVKDSPPSVTIWGFSASEADGFAFFSLQLSAEYDLPVAVEYFTGDGSAVAGQDYVATSGTVTFAPGETWKTIAVPLIADAVPETDEVFHVYVGNTSYVWFDWDNSSTEAWISDD